VSFPEVVVKTAKRELKQQVFAYLAMTFARFARAFFIFVHSAAVLVLSTT